MNDIVQFIGMPPASPRASTGQRPHGLKRYPIPQMIAALYWMAQLGYGARRAVLLANGDSRPTASGSSTPQLLSRSTLQRTFQSLPAHLRHPDSCTVAALLTFIQQEQGATRVAQQLGTSLLTSEEEKYLLDCMQLTLDSHYRINSDNIRATVIQIIARRGLPVQQAEGAAAGGGDEGSGDAEDEKENSQPNLPAPSDGVGVDADIPQKYAVAAVLSRRSGAVLRLRAIR